MNDVMQAAKAAIENVFSDTRVSAAETAARLRELHEYIREMEDALEADGVEV